MYERDHSKKDQKKQGLLSCSAVCSCIWFGIGFICLFVVRRKQGFLNLHRERFWKGKQSVGYANGIEGLERGVEKYFYAV